MGNLYIFSRHCYVALPLHINDFIALIHNTMVVQDKISKEVVLVAFFTCFINIKIEAYSSLEILTKELKKESIHANRIKNNGIHKGRIGIMLRLNWGLGMIKTIFLDAIVLYIFHMEVKNKLFLKNGWQKNILLQKWQMSTYTFIKKLLLRQKPKSSYILAILTSLQ